MTCEILLKDLQIYSELQQSQRTLREILNICKIRTCVIGSTRDCECALPFPGKLTFIGK